ncbi:MAG TPA: protein phosphatase 2C domain-containing protein [Ktedonobacterales bacterium]|nr:protein phosphatase 2C domain-containing protein [Ktedonobacterales bacterium]
MQCPYCNQPLRDQAKFCNNCGATLSPAVVSAVATPAEAPPPGKAEPTGPLNREPATPSNGAAPMPEQPAASDAAFMGTQDEALVPPPPPPPPPLDEIASEAMSTSAAGSEPAAAAWQDTASQEAAPDVVPSEQLYGLDPYSSSGDSMNTPEDQQAEEPFSADDVPTVRMPRPGQEETDVTAELLAMLGNQTPLQPGMLLEKRYHVEEVVHTSEEENLYRVTDKMGYLHCWACGADFPETQQPERFCSNCGADMLGKDYWLRERLHGAGAAEAGQPGAVESPGAGDAAPLAADSADVPGANGAHPEGATSEAALLAGTDQGYVDTESEELDWPTQPMTAIASFIVGPRHYRVEAMEIEEPIFPLGVTLAAGARSDVGRTRRGNPNEDSILVMELTRIHESVSQPFGLYIVADGLGGHDDGQTASRRAIGVIADYITREIVLPALQSGNYADNETLAAKLKGAVEAANLALVGSNEQTGSDMGSTVTGALIVGDTAHIVNVGDSRTYLYDTNALQPISVDHSLVMQLAIGGLIDREDIYTHPQRNQILRSLGDRRDVQIDLFMQKLRPGYQLLMCCDGLWEMIRDPQIEQVLRDVSDPQAAADRLVELANENGGEDNVSVIIVQARE